MAASFPVAGTVHEVASPNHGDAEIVGVEGKVDGFGIAHRDGSGTSSGYEVAIDGSLSLGRFNEHADRSATSPAGLTL